MNLKLELRAMTSRSEILDRSVMMSSLMPSLKYSCSADPLMFSNGRTAIERSLAWASPTSDAGLSHSHSHAPKPDDSAMTAKLAAAMAGHRQREGAPGASSSMTAPTALGSRST